MAAFDPLFEFHALHSQCHVCTFIGMSEHDPLGLESTELLGESRIDPGPPVSFDGSTELEIAQAVGRAVDALSELTKLLPLPPEVGEAFRRRIFSAWTEMLTETQLCALAPDDTQGAPDA